MSKNKENTALCTVQVIKPPLKIEALRRTTTIRVCLPPGYEKSKLRFPVLYMHDGQNIFDEFTSASGEWGVDETLTKLAIEEGFNIIVVGIDHGGEHRKTEMNPWDHDKHGKGEGQKYADFIVKKVKSFIDHQFRTLAEREHTGIMGSSLGGLISHYMLAKYPETFSKAAMFSPAYIQSDQIFDFVKDNPVPNDSKITILAGEEEGKEVTHSVERMTRILKKINQREEYLESAVIPKGKHTEDFWRAHFPSAVRWMFKEDGYY
ncbi:alpha/beta hydrolase [Portibacter marinus]|uniref:alpha/beta hydrolase n=1 Tax=Portibacter marinus TaxID=2898660 RepID=UPI001EEBC5E3|nr:alpha/beta hydrolase-fold protein [Portibacter marinus]